MMWNLREYVLHYYNLAINLGQDLIFLQKQTIAANCLPDDLSRNLIWNH